MLQNAFTSILMVLLPLMASKSQVICILGSNNTSYNGYADQRPSPDAMELAHRVNAALVAECRPNCPTLTLFRNPTAPNAILVADSGKAKMVYSPQFFTSVYEKYGDGAIIAIIAHMIGHGIDATAPAPWMQAAMPPELRADAWAGCALARTDLTATSLREGLTALSTCPSPAHPPWAQRAAALKIGYTHCGGNQGKFPQELKPK